MSRVKTAVILASGFGGRRMPVVSAIQKEMLPILNRPTIDYVVRDCVIAGIDNIIFVVRSDISQIEEYYTHPLFLDEQYKNINFQFVQRTEEHGNGTASALKAAFPLLKEQPFVVCAGDGFMYGERESYIKELIDRFSNEAGAMLVTKCPSPQLHKYGVMNNGSPFIVEKPKANPPTPFINTSQYVFSPIIISYIESLSPVDGEYRLTDAINEMVKDGLEMTKVIIPGRFFDTGDLSGWLEANRRMEPLDSSKVLVVGGAGFIGKHATLLGWDILDLKSGSDVREGIHQEYSTVVFLAADISQTEEAYRYNENLYKALDAYMRKYPNTHVIFSSSAAVYDNTETPQIERSILDPPTIYGRSKLLGEIYVQSYRRHTIMRFSNVYGAGEGNGVIDQFIRGDQPVGRGDTIRDYIGVDLVANCIQKAIKYPDDWHGIINISSGKGITVQEAWQKVNGDKPFITKDTRTDAVSYSVLNNDKMQRLLSKYEG